MRRLSRDPSLLAFHSSLDAIKNRIPHFCGILGGRSHNMNSIAGQNNLSSGAGPKALIVQV